jgi:hypothetical protein
LAYFINDAADQFDANAFCIRNAGGGPRKQPKDGVTYCSIAPPPAHPALARIDPTLALI